MRWILCATLLTIGLVASRPVTTAGVVFNSRWKDSLDRTWVGADYWANRLQDWRVQGRRLECVETRPLAMRTVHLLTHALAGDAARRNARFKMSVLVEPLGDRAHKSDARVGFLIGVGRGMEPRASALVHDLRGKGAGLFLGVDARGGTVLDDLESPRSSTETGPERPPVPSKQSFKLVLTGAPTDHGRYALRLEVKGQGDASTLNYSTHVVAAERTVGGVALVSHPGDKATSGTPARFGFRFWRLEGPRAIERNDPGLRVGPILSAQHTLSRGVLKLTAQLMPLGEADAPSATLQVRGPDGWQEVAVAPVIRPGCTATFRVPGWDDRQDVAYRVVYALRRRGTEPLACTWSGVVRRNPVDRPRLTLAAFTGHHQNSHQLVGGWGARGKAHRGNWERGLWFPHAELVGHVATARPDLLFFSGDQVYEGASPTFADRKHLMLDYLYKWYLWCWTWRRLTCDIPCVVLPDDHDVYQGNLWGHGGRKAKTQNHGGYVHPAAFVKMVERTQTSHLPDAFDPTPVDQGIGVYYTELNYGRVSFAVLEDRKFKSGCIDERLPPTGTKRPDHFNDPAFDTSRLDLPHLQLLGARQETFLEAWATDWRTTDMKAALSQTVFAGLATHHGSGLRRLIADLDSNGWPQGGRDRAVGLLRRARAVHVAGDQHLATLAQHGIERHRDAIWSFCVPSVANFYPRQWLPEAEGRNRPEGAPAWMGDHVDGFGNRVTVHAATNPRRTGNEPAELHDGMPGYGIVVFDRPERTITFDCRTRSGATYPGWPRTIHQRDNEGRRLDGHLPHIVVNGMPDPVIQVNDARTGETLYCLRIRGDRYRPPALGKGPFTVRVGCPDRGRWKTLADVRPVAGEAPKAIQVDLSE